MRDEAPGLRVERVRGARRVLRASYIEENDVSGVYSRP